LAQSGLVQLKHSGRSVMVELNAGFSEEGGDQAAARPRGAEEASEPERSIPAAPAPPAVSEPDTRPMGDNAEGVRLASQAFAAATNARWPMYLRNAKQLLRAAGLDERRYGFGGLLDLLRACQREGFIRLERDRRGGLRVFQSGVTSPVRPAPMPDV